MYHVEILDNMLTFLGIAAVCQPTTQGNRRDLKTRAAEEAVLHFWGVRCRDCRGCCCCHIAKLKVVSIGLGRVGKYGRREHNLDAGKKCFAAI